MADASKLATFADLLATLAGKRVVVEINMRLADGPLTHIGVLNAAGSDFISIGKPTYNLYIPVHAIVSIRKQPE